MILNPEAPKDWTLHVRITPDSRTHGHQWAIWVGRQPELIRIMKHTQGAHFNQNSKRWFLIRPASAFGATLQKLLSFGYRVDLEESNVRI